MVLTLKIISAAACYQDGAKSAAVRTTGLPALAQSLQCLALPASALAAVHFRAVTTSKLCLQELRPYQESMKLHLMPSLLEFFSYVFAAGNLLAGPFFEFRDYIEYIERKVGFSSQQASVLRAVHCMM